MTRPGEGAAYGAGRSCPVCGGSAFSLWGRSAGWEILTCKGCGLGLTSPVPAPGELEAQNAARYLPAARADIYFSRRAEFEERYRGYLGRIKKIRPAGALLDVGCNIGFFLKYAREAGFAVTGLELNRPCAAYGREKFGLDIRSVALEDGSLPAGAFDVITMFDVLEHVPDPGAFLDGARRLLKPGGLLVVQSPNFSSLMARLTGERWSWLTPPDHLYHFSPGIMIRFLLSHGFKARLSRTWEPARDFCDNVILAWAEGGPAARAAAKLLRLPGLARLAAAGLQWAWQLAGRGGLIEVYALKAGDAA